MKEKYFVVANSISKWKVDNVVENCLAYFADDSAFWKHIYVLFYKVCILPFLLSKRYLVLHFVVLTFGLEGDDLSSLSQDFSVYYIVLRERSDYIRKQPAVIP